MILTQLDTLNSLLSCKIEDEIAVQYFHSTSYNVNLFQSSFTFLYPLKTKDFLTFSGGGVQRCDTGRKCANSSTLNNSLSIIDCSPSALYGNNILACFCMIMIKLITKRYINGCNEIHNLFNLRVAFSYIFCFSLIIVSILPPTYQNDIIIKNAFRVVLDES